MLFQNNEIITVEKGLADTCNNHYINIIEKCSKVKPVNINKLSKISDNDAPAKFYKFYKN